LLWGLARALAQLSGCWAPILGLQLLTRPLVAQILGLLQLWGRVVLLLDLVPLVAGQRVLALLLWEENVSVAWVLAKYRFPRMA
jgi:hypothetical protein